MIDKVSSALGSSIANLRTQAMRVGVSADNIANLRTAGVTPGQQIEAGQFIPKKVDQVSLKGGGSRAIVGNVAPASIKSLDLATGEATSFLPNIDLAAELVEQLSASKSYEASLKVIEAVEEMTRKTIDIKT